MFVWLRIFVPTKQTTPPSDSTLKHQSSCGFNPNRDSIYVANKSPPIRHFQSWSTRNPISQHICICVHTQPHKRTRHGYIMYPPGCKTPSDEHAWYLKITFWLRFVRGSRHTRVKRTFIYIYTVIDMRYKIDWILDVFLVISKA